MTKITTPDALDLAKRFKAGALAVGQFQLDHWDELSKGQRRDLTDAEYTLLDHSQNLVTYAVGVRLDETQSALTDLQQATTQATRALQTIKDIKQVLAIAAALITLGAAVSTGNPAGIATVVSGLLATVKD